MPEFPVVSDEGAPVDAGDLARNLRMALLLTDAALPLFGAPRAATDEGARQVVADRSRLRGVAFLAALRELNRYEWTVSFGDLNDLNAGRVPEARDQT